MSACGQCRGLGCSNAMNTENIDNDESENEEEYIMILKMETFLKDYLTFEIIIFLD